MHTLSEREVWIQLVRFLTNKRMLVQCLSSHSNLCLVRFRHELENMSRSGSIAFTNLYSHVFRSVRANEKFLNCSIKLHFNTDPYINCNQNESRKKPTSGQRFVRAMQRRRSQSSDGRECNLCTHYFKVFSNVDLSTECSKCNG